MKSELAIGIDIGGTNIKYGFVTRSGKILNASLLKMKDYPGVTDFLNALQEIMVPIIMELSTEYEIRGVGIGAPNGNYYTGNIEYAPNLTWTGIIPLRKLISQTFSMPAALTNDANAAAVGEMMYGAAKGMDDFIVLTLGTGVGSGIVANGKLILGHDGFAGELGHVTVVPGGRLHPGTGMRGSLESYASATGVVRTAIEYLEADNRPSILRDLNREDLDSRKIYEAALKGDALAISVFEFTGRILGEALANFVMFSSPEAIILFGGLTRAGDILMNPVKENMEKNMLPIFQNKVKLMLSELNEADAAILGAAALIWDMEKNNGPA